jgi:hypothetical protein
MKGDFLICSQWLKNGERSVSIIFAYSHISKCNAMNFFYKLILEKSCTQSTTYMLTNDLAKQHKYIQQTKTYIRVYKSIKQL